MDQNELIQCTNAALSLIATDLNEIETLTTNDAFIALIMARVIQRIVYNASPEDRETLYELTQGEIL